MSFDQAIVVLIVICAIGSGLIAGVFFAFSSFVMKALLRLPPREGIVAMQAINIAVINPAFLGVFVVTALACVVLVVFATVHWTPPRSVYLICASLLYVFGTFGGTMFGNVPLNNALARLSPDDADAADAWRSYVRHWMIWNHLRTCAALVGMFFFAFSLAETYLVHPRG